MSKKEIVIPILVVVLSLAFALITLAVFFTKGKSAKWIKRKMKIGALLLTLNAFTPGSAQEIQHTCYDIAESNIMALQNDQTELIISTALDRKIKGYIDFRTDENFSFAVIDGKGNKLQTGTIKSLDGKFDNWKEDFEILLNKSIISGRYFLLLFDVSIELQNKNNSRNRIKLDVMIK